MYRSPLRYHEFVSMFLSFNLHLLLCIKLLLFKMFFSFVLRLFCLLFLLLLKITVVFVVFFSVHFFLVFCIRDLFVFLRFFLFFVV